MTKTRSLRLKRNNGCEENIKKEDKMFLYTAIGLFIAALIVMISQWIVWPGHWWDIDQTLHHENFAIILLAVGGGLLIARYAVKIRKK